MSLNDRITTVSPKDVLSTAYAALSGAQGSSPQAQVMAAFVYASLIASGLGLDARLHLEKADRIIADADTHYSPEVRAARDFIKNELKGN